MKWSVRIIGMTFALMVVGGLLGFFVARVVPIDWSRANGSTADQILFSYRCWGVVLGGILGFIAAVIYFWVTARGKRTTAYQQL